MSRMMMTMSSMDAMNTVVLDDIIRRLLGGARSGKQVQLSEAEIRQICVESRRIFLSQPNLLVLKAPIKICGLLSSLFSFFHWFLEFGAIKIGSWLFLVR